MVFLCTDAGWNAVKLVQLIDEDFVNYHKSSMVLGFPYCSFKCDKECGRKICQNSELANTATVDISVDTLIRRYLDNAITSAVVMQGLEPFDSFDDLYSFIEEFTRRSDDDIVIYTGYNEDEITDQVKKLADVISGNKLIIKYGRFVPGQEKHFDEILGVYLASNNQYARVI